MNVWNAYDYEVELLGVEAVELVCLLNVKRWLFCFFVYRLGNIVVENRWSES